MFLVNVLSVAHKPEKGQKQNNKIFVTHICMYIIFSFKQLVMFTTRRVNYGFKLHFGFDGVLL